MNVFQETAVFHFSGEWPMSHSMFLSWIEHSDYFEEICKKHGWRPRVRVPAKSERI